jgi:hypothetical protein
MRLDPRRVFADSDAILTRAQRERIALARARRNVERYSEDEPRDESGKWTDGGGGGSGGAAPAAESKPIAGFKPGVKASGAAAADSMKAEWFGRSPFKGDLTGAMAAARETQRTLGDVGRQIARELGVKFEDPGVKTDRRRIDEKVIQRGGVEKVTDLARGGFVVTRPGQADAIAQKLAEHFEVADESWKPTPTGYVDRALQFRAPNGLIGEVQVLEKNMADAKFNRGGHDFYKEMQRADRNSPEFAEAVQKQKDLYGSVFAALPADWQRVLKS